MSPCSFSWQRLLSSLSSGSTMAVALGSWKLLVGILRRIGEGSEYSSPQQWMFEFASVNSFRMKEDVSLISWVGEHQGEVGSTVKVVMVTMTSNGTPMGVTCRFSTGEIIFCAVWSSTRIKHLRSLQEIFECACFTCVFLSFTCKNKDYPSFFHITVFCSKQKVLYHFLHV